MRYFVIVDFKGTGLKVYNFQLFNHAKEFYDYAVNHGEGTALSVALVSGIDAPPMEVMMHYEWR